MPLHLLWTNLKHSTHKIELVSTPFLQTPPGCFPESSLCWQDKGIAVSGEPLGEQGLPRHCNTFVLPTFTPPELVISRHGWGLNFKFQGWTVQSSSALQATSCVRRPPLSNLINGYQIMSEQNKIINSHRFKIQFWMNDGISCEFWITLNKS